MLISVQNEAFCTTIYFISLNSSRGTWLFSQIKNKMEFSFHQTTNKNLIVIDISSKQTYNKPPELKISIIFYVSQTPFSITFDIFWAWISFLSRVPMSCCSQHQTKSHNNYYSLHWNMSDSIQWLPSDNWMLCIQILTHIKCLKKKFSRFRKTFSQFYLLSTFI